MSLKRRHFKKYIYIYKTNKLNMGVQGKNTIHCKMVNQNIYGKIQQNKAIIVHHSSVLT